MGALFEPRCEKTGLRGFPTRSDTNRAVQPQKLAKGWKFRIYVAKTKELISCAVTAQLICVFVFAYAKSRFSHDTAHCIILLIDIEMHLTFNIRIND